LEQWVEAVQFATQRAVETATQAAAETASRAAAEAAARAAADAAAREAAALEAAEAAALARPQGRPRRWSEPMPNPFKDGPMALARWIGAAASRGFTNHRVVFICGAAAVLVVAIYCVTAVSMAGKVPKGTTVAGVEIGGLSRGEAVEALNFSLASSVEARARVVVGQEETWINPKAAGLTFSASDTVAQVTGFSLSPARVWQHLAGGGNLAPTVLAQRGTTTTYLESVAQQTEIRAVEGGLDVAAAQAVISEPLDGLRLDVDAAVDLLTKSFLVAEEPWVLPTKAVRPAIGKDAVDIAVAAIAEPLLSGPVALTQSGRTVQLSVPELAAWATIIEDPSKPGRLALGWHEDLLEDAVALHFPELADTEGLEATFVFVDGQPVIQDGRPGTKLDTTALIAAMTHAATAAGDARRIALPLVTIDPVAGRAGLESLGIAEPVARYELPGAEPEDGLGAVALAAEQLTGQLVLPDQAFSLTKALGSPGTKLDGLATALFNAAFEAGMGDLGNTPHATYVARFGMGREASLMAGGDVTFRNDTPWGVLLRAGMTDDNRVWVELWSTKYWTVEAETGEPGSHIAARTIESSGPGCVPQPDGSAGFEIDYWRTRTDLYGSSTGQEAWSWRYAPTNRVSCKTES
jgi:vancomycin resistance protein YoaR